MSLFTIRWFSSTSWRQTGSSQEIPTPWVGEKKKERKGSNPPSHLTYLEEEEGGLHVTFDKFPHYHFNVFWTANSD